VKKIWVPIVVHCKKEEYDVYIGRPSINAFGDNDGLS